MLTNPLCFAEPIWSFLSWRELQRRQDWRS